MLYNTQGTHLDVLGPPLPSPLPVGFSLFRPFPPVGFSLCRPFPRPPMSPPEPLPGATEERGGVRERRWEGGRQNSKGRRHHLSPRPGRLHGRHPTRELTPPPPVLVRAFNTHHLALSRSWPPFLCPLSLWRTRSQPAQPATSLPTCMMERPRCFHALLIHYPRVLSVCALAPFVSWPDLLIVNPLVMLFVLGLWAVYACETYS